MIDFVVGIKKGPSREKFENAGSSEGRLSEAVMVILGLAGSGSMMRGETRPCVRAGDGASGS